MIDPRVAAALLGTTIGWLLSLVSPFLTHKLTLFFRGPKLEVTSVADETSTNIPGIQQLYVSVLVSNTKPRIARQCRGYLLRIEEMQGDKTVKTIFSRTSQCIWEFDDHRDSFDIPLGANPAFNVVSYQTKIDGFSPRLRLSRGEVLDSLTYKHLFGQFGKFRFSGIVTAEDIVPVSFAFDVDWTGEWPPQFKPATT